MKNHLICVYGYSNACHVRIDTTRAIRSLESTLDGMRLPIIALTAHALSDEKQKLLKVGMDDYVTKPIQIEQIIQILNEWTKNNFASNTRPEKPF
jgi:two-component system sensor histidine kinase BarA